MKGLKDFRRSLNKDRTSSGGQSSRYPTSNNSNFNPQIGIAPTSFQGVKNAVSIQPPKRVIKAIRDYTSRSAQELSFQKGDFFHVTSDSDNDWFEASNPITNARGLVPASFFEVLGKNVRQNNQGGGGGSSVGSSSPTLSQAGGMGGGGGGGVIGNVAGTRAAGAAMTAKGGGGLYARVKYDFAAERPDELDAKSGEPIIVIAQSNFEWFVAKPIGRLGGSRFNPSFFCRNPRFKYWETSGRRSRIDRKWSGTKSGRMEKDDCRL
ncbi:hypothetical protein L7F22_024637 [Adiantum nelumboides]|nr:hypothetical protein [Adiantum nelumboides]